MGVALLRRSHLTLSCTDRRSQTANPNNSNFSLNDVNPPGVAPLTWVLGRLASPVPPPRDTYPTELTPDTGLSHWWALPLALPRTPRLGGDRLGFY